MQVWLALGEITYVPPNLVADPTNKGLGFGPFYCGVAIPHGDPAVLDIYEAALSSMIEAYPDADRYWVCTGSEAHIAADDPRTQALIRDYAGLRNCSRPNHRLPWIRTWPMSWRPPNSCPGSRPVTQRPSSGRN